MQAITGTFRDPGPAISNIQPSGSAYTFDVTGVTEEHGDVDGTTSYVGTGGYDPATDKVTMNLKETFTGAVAGVGSGTATFFDHVVTNFENAPGTVDSVVIGGSGDLANVAGYLHWSWSSINADGSATGQYGGLLLNARCR